jgi:muramoyltetrapeptide carboxypeptidase
MKAPALKPGDTIGVMAPSSFVEKDDIDRAVKIIEAKGFKVFVHPQTYERDHQSAGTALQKTLALQGLWQRDDIKAIWCAGGGNRALHFMDSINFEALKKKPKILIGFSDVTVLLNSIYAKTGLTTIHGPVFKNLDKFQEWGALLALLSGETVTCDLAASTVLNAGTAEGPLIGGNLSLFQYLPQTLPGKFWEGAILFLEDCREELSKIDRMLLHLKRLGVLKEISGLVLGEFRDMQETGRPYGFSLADILSEHAEGLSIPVVMDAPFGHGKNLFPLPVGTKACINTQEMTLRSLEPAAQK